MKVIDTNILINSPDIIKTTNEDLNITIDTVCELNLLKSNNGKKGYLVRSALRELKNAFIENKMTTYVNKNGATISIVATQNSNIEDGLGKRDYNILRRCLLNNEILQTSDVAMAICALHMGIDIDFVDYIYKEYTGYIEHYVEKQIVDAIASNGIVESQSIFHSNEFVILRDITNPEHTAIARYDSQTNLLMPIKYKIKMFGIEPRPKNIEQTMFMNLLADPDIKIITAISQAGAGKTILSLAAALEQTNSKKAVYDKILVARALDAVDEEIGYLPGDKNEKVDPWHDALYDAYEIILRKNNMLKDIATREYLQQSMQQHKIEIGVITFMRGRSIQNSFIIIDEAQNIRPDVMRTILTRCAEGTKIVILGDPTQIDNKQCTKSYNGLVHVIESLYDKGLKEYAHIQLNKCERSKIADIGIKYL